MEISNSLAQTIITIHRDKGCTWILHFPKIIKHLQLEYSTKIIRPFPNFTYNYVALAKQNETEIVVQLGVPCKKIINEIDYKKILEIASLFQEILQVNI